MIAFNWLRILIAGLAAGIAFVLNTVAAPFIATAWLVMPRDDDDSDMGV